MRAITSTNRIAVLKPPPWLGGGVDEESLAGESPRIENKGLSSLVLYSTIGRRVGFLHWPLNFNLSEALKAQYPRAARNQALPAWGPLVQSTAGIAPHTPRWRPPR